MGPSHRLRWLGPWNGAGSLWLELGHTWCEFLLTQRPARTHYTLVRKTGATSLRAGPAKNGPRKI
jgi:hypothetical protein